MKNIKNFLFTFLVFGAVLSLTITGCKKEESNPTDGGGTSDPVPANIFPLTPGNVLMFNSGNLLHADSDSAIAGTSTGFQSKWIIAGKVAPGPAPYTQPTLIIDTTIVAGQTARRNFLAHHDTVSNEFWFLTNLGYFFRSQQINGTDGNVRGDSLRWILLAKPSAGIGVEWVSFNETFTSALVGPVRLEIKAAFEAKETLAAAGTTFETYRLVSTRRVYLGTSTTSISTGITARLWMVDNVGPVKIELRGDAESNGKVQTLTGKNF